jgi:hypothetical protein
MFTFFHSGESRQGSLVTGEYEYGGLAVRLVVDGEDYAMLSVFIPHADLGPDEFLFKTYSENQGLLEAMIAAGAIVFTGYEDTAAGPFPVCRIVS